MKNIFFPFFVLAMINVDYNIAIYLMLIVTWRKILLLTWSTLQILKVHIARRVCNFLKKCFCIRKEKPQHNWNKWIEIIVVFVHICQCMVVLSINKLKMKIIVWQLTYYMYVECTSKLLNCLHRNVNSFLYSLFLRIAYIGSGATSLTRATLF